MVLRRTVLLLLVASFLSMPPSGARAAQPNTNFIELAHVDPYAQYNDCYGYRDPNTGVEYAILGTNTGTSVWNVGDPFNPYETGFIPSTGATPNHWRDFDTYGDNLYVTTEGSAGGLQVIDLANPEAPVQVIKKHNFTSHTLWIDQGAGVAYCMGAGGIVGAAGFRGYSLADPNNPTILADWASPYYHDLWASNGVAYGAAIFEGGHFDILRVTNLPTVTVKAAVAYANGFTHNVWPSDDGQYLYSTDELLGTGTVRVWDISDTASVVQVAQFPVWTNTCVHNVYIKNDTAYCAWYEEGVLAFDVTDPLTPVQIGSFDTGPDTVAIGNYAGCWTVYPFLPSGVVVSSDIKQGMHLLYYADEIGVVSGTVTDFVTGLPIAGAEVAVPDFFNRRVTTDGAGNYSAILPGGSHDVNASAAGYLSDLTGAAVTDGDTTDLDIALVPSAATGVGAGRGTESGSTPRVVLGAPSPNPTRGEATVSLDLPRAGAVSLAVFDSSGRLVRTLAAGALPAGRHAVAWDGRDDAGRAVASGAFVVRLDAGGERRSAKLVLTR